MEYAAVLALAATVLAVTGLFVGGAPIGNDVVRGLERALCRVTGASCATLELQACTVRSRETQGELGVKLTLVKLGGSLSLLREERSDGTVDVSLIDGAEVAPTAGLGASGGVRLGGDRLGGGAITKAELLVRLGRRRVWRRPDAASADRLVTDIVENVAAGAAERALPVVGTGVRRLAHLAGYDGDTLPPADVTGLSGGVDGALEAELPSLAAVKAGFSASLGGTHDRRAGTWTYLFSLDGEGEVALTRAAGGTGLTGQGGATVAVTYDRRRRPVALRVTTAGVGRGALGLGLPGHRAGGGGAQRVEITSSLDLEHADNRAAYEHLLRALDPIRAAALPGAVAGLAARIRAGARVDVDRYSSSATEYGADGELAVGARVGGSVRVSRTATELQDAWTRPAGGAWEQRGDCLDGRTQV